MYFITSDKYRVIDIRDHINIKAPIWTKGHQYAVQISSTEFLDLEEETVDNLSDDWVVLQ